MASNHADSNLTVTYAAAMLCCMQAKMLRVVLLLAVGNIMWAVACIVGYVRHKRQLCAKDQSHIAAFQRMAHTFAAHVRDLNTR